MLAEDKWRCDGQQISMYYNKFFSPDVAVCLGTSSLCVCGLNALDSQK